MSGSKQEILAHRVLSTQGATEIKESKGLRKHSRQRHRRANTLLFMRGGVLESQVIDNIRFPKVEVGVWARSSSWATDDSASPTAQYCQSMINPTAWSTSYLNALTSDTIYSPVLAEPPLSLCPYFKYTDPSNTLSTLRLSALSPSIQNAGCPASLG